jgi:hypothetical protein
MFQVRKVTCSSDSGAVVVKLLVVWVLEIFQVNLCSCSCSSMPPGGHPGGPSAGPSAGDEGGAQHKKVRNRPK